MPATVALPMCSRCRISAARLNSGGATGEEPPVALYRLQASQVVSSAAGFRFETGTRSA